MRFPNLSLPKWSLYAIGLAPLTAIFVIIVISVVGGGSGRGGLVTFDDTGEVEVLRETPSDFDLELFSGEVLTLSEEIGERPVLIDFWGSWCVPCRREAPVLEAVWRRYQDRVLFIGIDVFDTESRARDFLREFGVTYPVGPDPRGTIVISVVGGGSGRGGLVTFDDTGEVEVLRETPSDFDLELFSGEVLTLSEEIGERPILIDFWGSWCVPCRREAPVLEAVWRRYQDRVLFIGIDVFDTEARARDYLREFGVTYPVGPDPRGTIAIEYGLTGVPEKHFIDRGGRVVRKFVGPLNEERLAAILDDVLAIP